VRQAHNGLIEGISVEIESWPLRVPFRISRGAKSEATVVSVALRSGRTVGRGECCPYARYGETVPKIAATLRALDLNSLGCSSVTELRTNVQTLLPPGSARNALDCALWDLEAKLSNTPVWQLADLPQPASVMTCFTLSLDTPVAMANDAKRHAECPLLKLKLGDAVLDPERMRMVRAARPDSRLVADANEGWSIHDLNTLRDAAIAHGIELIEQPLPAADDTALASIEPITGTILCADESAAPGQDVRELVGRYQAVNVKLDKAGGLTSAIRMITEARRLGLKIMIGSMVSTSLSMAPAALLGPLANWVDLDSPLLLDKDRAVPMKIVDGWLKPPSRDLWG